MDAKNQLNRFHLVDQAKRFESAVEEVRALINHKDKEVRALTVRLLTVSGQALFCAMGGSIPRTLGAYTYCAACGEAPDSPVARLEFIRYFVLIEILKNGDPAVGHCRYGLGSGFTLCAEGDGDAEPYFHQSLELLQESHPNSRRLTLARAVEILNRHEVWDRQAAIHGVKEDGDDPAMYEPTEEETLLAELADQLRGQPTPCL